MSTTQRKIEKQHISVQAPVWLRIELEALAARNGRSLSAEIREVLQAHVNQEARAK